MQKAACYLIQHVASRSFLLNRSNQAGHDIDRNAGLRIRADRISISAARPSCNADTVIRALHGHIQGTNGHSVFLSVFRIVTADVFGADGFADADLGIIAVFVDHFDHPGFGINTNDPVRIAVDRFGEREVESDSLLLNIVTTIIDAIAVAVEWISDIVTEICAFISEIWQEHGDEIMAGVQAVGDFFAIIWNGACEIFGQVIEILKLFWEAFGEDIKNVIKTAWEFISDIFGGAINVISGILDIVVGIFTGNGEKIKEGFGMICEGIKQIFLGMVNFFSGIWDSIVSVFTKVGTKIGDAVSGAFKAVVNNVLSFIESIINGAIRGINSAINLINKIPGVSISSLSSVSFTRMAAGGFVEPGEFFIAREAGPELVGNIGSHTAVMNNNQIVQSVSNGVYMAQQEQNALLAEQNALLRQLLNSTASVTMNVNETQFAKVAVKAINSLARTQGKVNLAL